MKKTWVTIFERYEDFHFYKDVGQLPFHVQSYLNFDVEIWRKENGSYIERKEIRIKSFDCSNTGTKVSLKLMFQIAKKSRSITVLNLFHFRLYSLIYAAIYKLCNFGGKVIIKCDGSDGFFPFSGKKLKYNILYALIAKFKIVDLVLAEHLSLVDFFERKNIPALHCPNGVSKEYYQLDMEPNKNITPSIIFVGKCGDSRKNAEEAVKAVSELKFDCKVYFLGGETESFRNWFKVWINNYSENIKERFVFLGYVTDPKEVISYFDRAHVFIMSSKHEGYPLSLAQAAWRGCFPILSQGSGGTDMNKAGCAEVYNNFEELVQKLTESLIDLKSTEQLGRKARMYALENNDWRVKVKKIQEQLNYER
ncbi:TPA: glycosyltransferase family 4 protein [Enterobacter kobei]|uniref:glycosyltransferase family 4 protein n=1 Tax=Enterobacter kobei TaxID=208224 RepID=UPI000B3D2B1B|nr:glycosyltransferase family 4 protein [Enterobacter kobei]MBT1797962.1 glycosyltransferase family 4 protein [Enterobacter kobei]MBW7696045.1 glycosyltransferase family 4 protein [Enterobacter kobei]MBW7771746.1 glycosyltransferase family 4 protein [Enterobacter kobei]MCK6863137.1 glycosyltransferase family 4 protein [Enterobacter kobei]MCO7420071.1 glycosyltransferase family 4 protein [Enterobacter kobei]